MSALRTAGARSSGRVLGVALAITAAGFSGLSLASLMAHERTTVTNELLKNVTRVELGDVPGKLQIEGSDEVRNRLTQMITSGVTTPDVSWRVEGSTLFYDGNCRWFDSRCGIDVGLRTARNARIAASISGGDVEVQGMTGQLDLRSDSGEVHVDDSTGDMNLASSGGDVQGRRLGAERVTAESSGGDVRLEFSGVPREVVADSSAGDVEIVLPPGPAAYRVDTTSSAGDTNVGVRTDPNSNRSIRVSSSAGNVTVRYAAGA